MDDELEITIKELLNNSRKLDASDISVTVDKRNVRLSGSVKSQDERDYALRVVKLVQGIGDIHSDLVVKINHGILPSDIGRHP
jgi:osmotically-inducible protein OsmY